MEAQTKISREVVAIKKMRKQFMTWEEAMSLREIRVLRRLTHPNVVKLKEVIRQQNDLFLVFELVKGSVLDLLQEKQRNRAVDDAGLPEETVRSIIKQCL